MKCKTTTKKRPVFRNSTLAGYFFADSILQGERIRNEKKRIGKKIK